MRVRRTKDNPRSKKASTVESVVQTQYRQPQEKQKGRVLYPQYCRTRLLDNRVSNYTKLYFTIVRPLTNLSLAVVGYDKCGGLCPQSIWGFPAMKEQ